MSHEEQSTLAVRLRFASTEHAQMAEEKAPPMKRRLHAETAALLSEAAEAIFSLPASSKAKR